MVAEIKREISQEKENYPTSAVRLVIERKRGRNVKLLFEKKVSPDLYDRMSESWDLPMAISEGESPEEAIAFLSAKISGRKNVKHEHLWHSEPELRFFRERQSEFVVQRFYQVKGVPINRNDNFRLMTVSEALNPKNDLPEVTRQFLQEKYLGVDK